MRMILAAVTVILVAAGTFAQDDISKRKVPHQKDETSLVRIKANPEAIIGKKVVICGFVTISDYYNYGYEHSNKSHFSIAFLEAGETIEENNGATAHLYFAKTDGAGAVEVITQAAEKQKLKLVRAEVTLTGGRYVRGRKWDLLEVSDFQFYDATTDNWGPWFVRPAKEKAEKERLKKEAEESLKKAEKKTKEQKAIEPAPVEPKFIRSDEEIANSKLKLAKLLLTKNKSDSMKKLQEIINKYPKTDAAKAAQELIGKNQ